AFRIIDRSVTLVAVSWPFLVDVPEFWLPDLFGLMDATSYVGVCANASVPAPSARVRTKGCQVAFFIVNPDSAARRYQRPVCPRVRAQVPASARVVPAV